MHTIVDVVLEASPSSFQLLSARVQAFAHTEDPKLPGVPSFVRLKQIDQLHFISLQIFQDRHYDPLLVLESNFDGDAATYWKKALQLVGQDLRTIFACTKAALDPAWAGLFVSGSTDPLDCFIQAHSVGPSASHVGALGMALERVNRDRIVYKALQTELGGTTEKFRGLTPAQMQKQVRDWAVRQYPWLKKPEEWSFRRAKTSYRWAAIRSLLPLLILGLVSMVTSGFLCLSDRLPGEVHVAVGSVLVSFGCVTLALASFSWVAIRRLEASDMTQEDPALDPVQLAAFAAQEDQIVQNHLSSMALVKPGVLRGIAIHGSLGLLKLAVPFFAADGYLGSMRTIHFAHWTLIGNSSRLMFLSNFDGSWQSYLDDFVDKAHHGLTLAWGNCIGFPRTKNLVQQGASHGAEFKAWARQGQTQSILWYSAYADLTVNQIWRNARIVDGLRRTKMTDSEARQWAELL